MVQRAIHLGADGVAMADLVARFARARAELQVAEEFPAEALAAAEQAARSPRLPAADLTDLGFVTVDPPGSTDLDQAMCLRRSGDGFAVDYAIADVPAFVPLGGPVAAEAARRGQTLYSPDRRVPLHPPVLSEGAASLLEGQVRPAFVWRFTLEATGTVTAVDLVRALVRSRHRLDYAQVQAAADSGAGEPDVVEQARLLREVGLRRIEQERARGGASLPMPEQEVDSEGGRFELRFRPPVPAEDWNAQLSLMTGMAAAELMLKAGFGVLRTMPPPTDDAVFRLRRQARALGVEWPTEQPYGDLVRGLDRTVPRQLALLHEAAGLFRGAAYSAFDGAPPEVSGHAAVAAPYAHVTAPLRRLVDRFGLLVCHAVVTGGEPDGALRAALPGLVERMAESDRTAKSLERRCIDLVEAAVLAPRVGETFHAVTIDQARDRTQVQLLDPAVVAPCEGRLPLGRAVTVRLESADPDGATVRFVPADRPSR